MQEFVDLARKSEIFSEDLLESPCQITAIFIKEDKLIILLFKHTSAEADLQIFASFTESRSEAVHILDNKVLADAYYLNRVM